MTTKAMNEQSSKEDSKWFYAHLPIEMGRLIDSILDERGNEIGIYSRTEFVRVATRDLMLRLLPSKDKDKRQESSTATV